MEQYHKSDLYANYLKRLLDLFVALVMFTLLSPLFLAVTILLIFANQGKPYFFQRRPGLNGKIFKVIKFKTMNDRKDKNGELLPDAVRLTPVGKFVREKSLDEVPQLLNVILGHMSIIGPRPLLEEYLPLYSAEQMRRHNVRPGITGWAQVNGRNAISWEDKFKLDVWYVDNRSLWLDMKILWLTILRVVRRSGISQDGHVTMEKFRGTTTGRAR